MSNAARVSNLAAMPFPAVVATVESRSVEDTFDGIGAVHASNTVVVHLLAAFSENQKAVTLLEGPGHKKRPASTYLHGR